MKPYKTLQESAEALENLEKELVNKLSQAVTFTHIVKWFFFTSNQYILYLTDARVTVRCFSSWWHFGLHWRGSKCVSFYVFKWAQLKITFLFIDNSRTLKMARKYEKWMMNIWTMSSHYLVPCLRWPHVAKPLNRTRTQIMKQVYLFVIQWYVTNEHLFFSRTTTVLLPHLARLFVQKMTISWPR